MDKRSGMSLVEVMVSVSLLAVAGLALLGFLARVSNLDHLARLRLKAGMLAMDEYTQLVGTRPKNAGETSSRSTWTPLHHGRKVATTFEIRKIVERTASKRDVYTVTVSWNDSAGGHQVVVEGVKVMQ